MIFNFKYFKPKEIACVPYPLQWLEPNYTYETRTRFALFPRRLFEYEDRKTIHMGGMTPDDYRLFVGTNRIIWLEKFLDIKAYHRVEARLPAPHKASHYAVDPYFFMISSM